MMKFIGFVWAAVGLFLFFNYYLRSLTDPTGEVLWMATAFLGTVGTAAIFGLAERSLIGSVRAAAIFAACCWFLWMNLPVYSMVMRKIQADEALKHGFAQRPGEDSKTYCSRLVYLLRGPDPVLRLAAVRRLQRCGADGAPALERLALLSAAESDRVMSGAATESRKEIEKAAAR
jgi:hypothetical protein